MSYFDHFADSSGTVIGDWITRRINTMHARMITRLLPDQTSDILEIGPGAGRLALMLKETGYGRYTVVEPNIQFRQQLAEHGFMVKSYMIPALKEVDNAYNAIVLQDVFEHLNSTAEVTTFFAEASRVLRPDGLIVIMAPDFMHWKEEFYNCDYTHNNPTTVRRTQQLLYNDNFDIVYSHYYSGCIGGVLATPVSQFVRLALAYANSTRSNKKLYKLKLTFMRRFVIVGKKRGSLCI